MGKIIWVFLLFWLRGQNLWKYSHGLAKDVFPVERNERFPGAFIERCGCAAHTLRCGA